MCPAARRHHREARGGWTFYRIRNELQRAGYVRRSHHGRRNRYRVDPDRTLGDPVAQHPSLRELLRLIGR
jgi:DNA-binding IclR family transcriptional regulator